MHWQTEECKRREPQYQRLLELEAGYKRAAELMGHPEGWKNVLQVALADQNCVDWMTLSERTALEQDLSYANHVIEELKEKNRILEAKLAAFGL